jgi:hypothetical protein
VGTAAVKIRRRTTFDGDRVWLINSRVCSVYYAKGNWNLLKHLWWTFWHTINPWNRLWFWWHFRHVSKKQLMEAAERWGAQE